MNKNRIVAMIMIWAIVVAVAPNYASAPNQDGIPLNQGWTEEGRKDFYHKAQGTRLIPYSWFEALERPEPGPIAMLKSRNFIEQLGLLPDETPDEERNPYGFPIGFARTKTKDGPDYLGFNCAFCHTGQINYTDPSTYTKFRIRIDGGSSMQFSARFVKELVEALFFTLNPAGMDEEKFKRFSDRVMAKDPYYSDKGREVLRKEVHEKLQEFVERSRLDPFEWGFGRFDALGSGGNTIFYEFFSRKAVKEALSKDPNLDPEKKEDIVVKFRDDIRVANGPVSIPSIWGTLAYDRMQWNGSIENFLARGIAEAISAGASPLDPDLLKELQWMEGPLRKLQSPPWPSVFPPVDPEKRNLGRTLYTEKKCAGCHGAAEGMLRKLGEGEKIVLTMVPVKEIGTDPTAAMNYVRRKVNTGNAMPIPAATVMKGFTDGIMAAAGSVGKNEWYAKPEYVARPLDGIWATPPYLHNGSVPNLYQLLSPVSERHKCFYVDTREYDPIRVGYVIRRCDFQSRLDDPSSGFELDAARLGNSNTGHEFRRNAPTYDPNDPTRKLSFSNAVHVFSKEECDTLGKIGEERERLKANKYDTKYDEKKKTYVPIEEYDPVTKKPAPIVLKINIDGIIGCELKDDERWQLIEYLKTLPERPMPSS